MADLGQRKVLTSRDAADLLDVNVQRFHRLVAKHSVTPTFELPGKRGAKFWDPRDIGRLAGLLADRLAS